MPGRKTLLPVDDVQRRMQFELTKPGKTGGGVALYSFFIIDPTTGETVSQFGFDIPPVSIRTDEDAASDAFAAQEGGYWTDDRGQYFKMVTINGTFGFRPTPKGPAKGVRAPKPSTAQQITGAIPSLNQPVASKITKERTGEDRYRALHNLVRLYWDRKGVRATAHKTVFVWANWRMGEVYIAQPMRFSRDRSAPSGRLKITYSLNLRLLAPLEGVERPKDFLKSPFSRSGRSNQKFRLSVVVAKLETLKRQIEDVATLSKDFAFNLNRNILDTLQQTITDIGKSLEQAVLDVIEITEAVTVATITTVLAPAHLISEAVRRCIEAGDTIGQESGFFFDEVRRRFYSAARNLSDAFVGLMSVGSVHDVNATADAYAAKYRRKDEQAALSNDGIPLSNTQQSDGGSKTAIGAAPIPTGSQTMTLPGQVTIKALAAQFLGAAGRWKEIVLLNKLRPPYISPSGDGVTVLRPGDPIKLPATPDEQAPENNVFASDREERSLDAYRFGRDIKMDLRTEELQISQGGDLDTVEGTDNLVQALHLKVRRKPGDLRAHPWFGFGAEAGEGLAVDTLAGYHLHLRTTLLSDTRIERIASMSFQVKEDQIHIKSTLVPKDQDDALALDMRATL